jgi:hypothetical protein
MSNNLIHLNTPTVSYDTAWQTENIEPTTRKEYIDQWEIGGEYPFTIEQQYKTVWTDEYKAKMDSLTPQEKAFMKMNMNAMYGATTWLSNGGYIQYPNNSIGLNLNSVNPIKSMYYMNSRRSSKCYDEVIVPHEGTAICIQKERLVAHFKHKISKTSKKKKFEIENLNKIIEGHQKYINSYIDEFPERFI